MACVNPDGTLSASARAILKGLSTPSSAEELAKATGLPLFRIRSGLREMLAAELVRDDGGKFIVTQQGKTMAGS